MVADEHASATAAMTSAGMIDRRPAIEAARVIPLPVAMQRPPFSAHDNRAHVPFQVEPAPATRHMCGKAKTNALHASFAVPAGTSGNAAASASECASFATSAG